MGGAISIIEARKYLGAEAEVLNDEQIEVLLNHLELIAKLAIAMYKDSPKAKIKRKHN